jgi:superfamily II DNA or RNA helicase
MFLFNRDEGQGAFDPAPPNHPSAKRMRDYQQAAYEGVFREFGKGVQSTLVVLPTGTGKTVLFSKVANAWQDGNVLILAHRVELLNQAADKLASDLGFRPPIEQGQRGLEEDMIWQGGNVIVGSVQTMRNMKRMAKYRGSPFGLVIVDEAHHAVSASYRKIIDQCLELNPNCKVMGVTATPNRADKAALGIVFDSVAYGMELQEGIEQGWLVDIRQEYIQIDDVDFSGITLTRNKFGEADFRRDELETILTEEKALHAMAKPLLDRSTNGEQCLVFNAGVAHAHLMAAVLNRYKDQSAAAVDGKTDPVRREEIVRDFKAGRLQYLCNFGVFTEGFDAPSTVCVVMARPTRSVGLYLQMLGRGTRPLEGVVDGPPTAELRKAAIAASAKTHMVALDYVNNSRHKPVSVVDALGGDYDAEVRALAEDRIREKKDTGTVQEELEKAKADVALYGEEEKRKTIKAQEVRYTSHQVDVFGRGATPVGQSVDVPRGGASDGQIAFLCSFGVAYATAAAMSRRQIGAAINSYKERTCTAKMANILQRFGYQPVPFDQAKSIIDRIAANGWRRPE